jgi:cytochrome c oxidase subunit II
VRRKLPSFVLLLLVALATAGVAAAGNGGLAPVTPHSPNAVRITDTYWVVFGFTAFVFVLIESLLVIFIVKYRSRGRSRAVEGAQVHGHTRLELLWTVFPVLILAAIAVVVFWELPSIDHQPSAATNPIHITVEGHQYYWQFDYPNHARSIGTLHVPVGAVVDLKVVSPDVIHSWWIPALGGKIQAIPGRVNHTWFRADAAGTYTGQCAELCGVFHASMLATVKAESAQSYRTFITKTAPATLGAQEWSGVCATCHGNLGQGGYGPAISNNTIITQPAALAGILRNGVNGTTGAMPPVGNTWTNGQILALVRYMQKDIYKPAPVGATSGG